MLSESSAKAQQAPATLTGEISDSTGAAIPGATLTITNVNTGLSEKVTSNASGLYSIPALQPGTYSLTVSKEGFQQSVQTDILLTVGQAAALKVVLQPGNVMETITVSAAGELINTTNAEISQVVDQRAVQELPLNGRDPSSLVLLSPGTSNVLIAAGNASFRNAVSFPTETGASAGGGRQGSTYYLLDGAPNVDTYQLLASPFPNADATQEFRVITNNFDARYGSSPGAVVSIETRSGTNDFHGGGFAFFRNSALNAGNYFTHAVDSLNRQQYGGFIGGPAIKNKLFFFGNYQGTRSSLTAASNSTFAPTAAMLRGDFSAVTATLKAPFATVNGVRNQINPALFNPASVRIATTAYPLGQVASTGQVFYTGSPNSSRYDEGTGRVDYDLSGKQRISARSFVDYFLQPGTTTPGNILATVNGLNGKYFNLNLGHTWTINDRMVNSFNVFWTQNSVISGEQTLDSTGNPLCLSKLIPVADKPGSCYLLGFQVTNGYGGSYTEPYNDLRTSYGLDEVLTRTVGNHTMTFGGNLWHQFMADHVDFPTSPVVQFNGSVTGYGISDFLLGNVYSLQQGGGEIAVVRGWLLGLFAQDQYKLEPNLTITAGLRWDPNTPPAVVDGRGSQFAPGAKSGIFPNAPVGILFPGDPGVDNALMPTTYRYFEPRLGVAFQPKSMPNTSFRAGFGLFEGPIPYVYYSHVGSMAPFSPTYLLTATASNPINFSNPYAGFTANGGKSPFPPFAVGGVIPPANSPFIGALNVGASFTPNFRLGMTQSWNASVEQQIGKDVALHIAYVGSESYHQAVAVDRNPGIYSAGSARALFPAFGQVLQNQSAGTAAYHSLQVAVDKRVSHGLQAHESFTWSKAIDTATTGDLSQAGAWLPNPFNLRYNRGNADTNFPIISVTNLVYTTPSLKGWNGVLRGLLGEWQASGIMTLQSGIPFTIQGGNGNNNSGSLQASGNYGDRADVTGLPFLTRQGGKANWLTHYFSSAAFKTNAVGTFGNSPRNVLNGPPIRTVDVSFAKNWTLRERYRTQFRWEMFNALNHPSFGLPNTNPSASNFGQITTIGSVAPRVMQGAVKLTF